MSKLDGIDVFLKKLEMEEEKFVVPRGLDDSQEDEEGEESKL